MTTARLLPEIAAGAIFAATYLVLAIGRLPGLRLDRAGASLLGAALMVACGGLSLDAAYRAIDLDTLALLLGTMIVVANLRLSGIFRRITQHAARLRHPLLLLAAVTLTSGVFSAFLVNDTICLALAPLVLDLASRLRRDPVPYLLAFAMASNAGSAATITGNPQNILIGSASHMSYAGFAAALAPVAAAGLVLTMVLIALFHPREFFNRDRLHGAEPERGWVHRGLAAKSLLVAAAMVAGFFAGLPPAKVALLGGGVLLLTRSVKPQKVYRQIDGSLLLMFAGLFVVVAGYEAAMLTPDRLAAIGRLHLENTGVLSLVTAALSNLVSNVPAVLVLRPFVLSLADPQRAWLVVAMSSTLAGNFTVLGSVANLIVVQHARAHGVAIGFWDYFRVGAPLTVLTILAGIWWL